MASRRRHDLLMPDVRRIMVDRETDLLIQFAAKGRQQALSRFHSTARRRPNHSCPVRAVELKPAQQDAVVFVENDPARARAQPHR